ncbi:helix-turn-helix domain-containing protein [Streptomyces sp. NPDC091281]|uniref:helix-turn-helix domain-containing protein n=1 Tax=Streptomyces sp. NPDC091281 TaxID=3365985 RepID=UPI0038007E8C
MSRIFPSRSEYESIVSTPNSFEGNGNTIPGYGFNSPRATVPNFEMMDLDDVHGRGRDGALERFHRTDFHAITLISEGAGEHTADFVTHPCRPGTLLWLRPGQVQRFGTPGTMRGPHLIFTSAFPVPVSPADRLLHEWYGQVCWQLGTGKEYEELAVLIGQIRGEFERPDRETSSQILQLLLATLLLHIDRLPGRDDPTELSAETETVYSRFRAELERSYATTRRVEDYADSLGYSVKTLSRACLAATGKPAKHVIDARVVLEAQRLLAHTGEPVAAIARRLGFSEPTNFGSFFSRLAGTSPKAFRQRQGG